MFHELFPCKYSWAYSSSCAQIIVHSNVFLLWQTCSIHVHIYFHHGLHVFTACIFTCSLYVFSACKYPHLCIVYDKWWSMFYYLFPYKYSCVYPSSCAQNSVLSTVDRASAFWHYCCLCLADAWWDTVKNYPGALHFASMDINCMIISVLQV